MEDITLQSFASLLLVGAVVSGVTEFLSNKLTHWASVMVVAAMSLGGAVIYHVLLDLGYWTAFVQVLTMASAIYAIFVRAMQKGGTEA